MVKRLLTILVCVFFTCFAQARFANQEIFIPPNSPLVPDIEKMRSLGSEYVTITTGDGESYFVKVLSVTGDPTLGYYFGFSYRSYVVALNQKDIQGDLTAELKPMGRLESVASKGSSLKNGGSGDSGGSRGADGLPGQYSPGQGVGGSVASAVASAGLSAIGSHFDKKLQKLHESIAENEAERLEKLANIESMKVKIARDAISVSVEIKETTDQLKPFKSGAIDPLRVSYVSNRSKVDLKNHQWVSKDLRFVSEADEIRKTLTSSAQRLDLHKEAFEIGKEALMQADQWSAVGAQVESRAYLDFAQASADILTGWDPYTGVLRSFYETVTGKNPFTQKPLSGIERTFSALGLVSAGYAAKLPVLYELMKPLVKASGQASIASFKHIGSIVEAQRSIKPEYRNAFVRSLPDLTGTRRAAFEGHIFKGVGEPGSILYQAQRTGQKSPGHWFGSVKPVDSSHAEALSNLAIWGNDAGQIKTYVLKERVSVYAGKVAGGEGHQLYIPEGIPLEKILIEIK